MTNEHSLHPLWEQEDGVPTGMHEFHKHLQQVSTVCQSVNAPSMGPLHGTPCPPCIGLPPWDPLLTVALLVFHSCPEVEVSLLGSSEVWKVFARHEHPHSMRNLHRAGMLLV